MAKQLGQLLEESLRGEPVATRTLVTELTPVIQARVARALLRRGRRQGRDVRQELADMVQEIFVCLFEDDARVLRSWSASRGLSLENFVGLVAERQIASLLRSGKRNPWTEDPTLDEEMDTGAESAGAPDAQVASRESLQLLLDKLRERLSPQGLGMFQALLVEERDVEDVCAAFGMTPDAVYAWRSRLARLVRSLAAELSCGEGVSKFAAPTRIPVGTSHVS